MSEVDLNEQKEILFKAIEAWLKQKQKQSQQEKSGVGGDA